MIGPDGHGWMGHDKNGNVIFKDDDELERESAQCKADAQRSEKLYVSEDYKVFFLTRQPDTNGSDDRNAYISIKPFNVIPAEALDQMRSTAEPWSLQTGSQVRIEVRDPLLVFHDDITKTESQIFVGELDLDVRQRLRAGQGAANAWDKLFNAAAAANPSATVSTKDSIAVHRPLTLKRTPCT